LRGSGNWMFHPLVAISRVVLSLFLPLPTSGFDVEELFLLTTRAAFLLASRELLLLLSFSSNCLWPPNETWKASSWALTLSPVACSL
jgi:hypothetical protein